jgi:hypothetical protein
MSQKSSVPQRRRSVSGVMTPDNPGFPGAAIPTWSGETLVRIEDSLTKQNDKM